MTLLPGTSQDVFDAMKEDVLSLASETGKMPDEILPALYQAISAGVPPDNVFEFLRTSNEAAVGGVTDLETAVDGISSVVNAYGDDVISAADASDQMFTAVKLGKTNFEELSASLFQVVPTASALGVQFGDVTAALAAMTAQGTPTSVATTQLRQLFVELSKEGSKAAGLFEDLAGKSFQEFIAEGGNVSDALKIMEKGAAENDVALQDLFGSVEAGSAALQLTGGGAEKFDAAIAQMGESAGETSEAFDTMDSGVSSVGKKVAATFGVLSVRVGEFFEPLAPAVVSLNAMAPAMRGLVTPAKALGGVFGAIGGRALPLLAKGFGSLGGKLIPTLAGSIGGAFTGIVPALGGAVSGMMSGVVGLLGAAMPLLAAAWPLLLGAAIVAGIALLFSNEEIRTAVFDFIGGVLEWLGDALGSLGDFLGGIFGAAFEAVGAVVGAALEVITAPIRAFVDFLGGIFGGLAGAAEAAWSVVSTIVGKYLEIITFPIRTFIGLVTGIFDAAPAAAGAAWDLITGIVGTAIEIITAPIRFLIDLVVGMFSGAPEAAGTAWNAISGIVGAAIGIITAPIRFLIDLAGGMFDLAKGAASAAWSVITGIVKGAVGAITGVIQGIVGVARGVWDTVTGIFGGIKDAAASAVGFVGDVAGNVGGFFGNLLPFQTGAWEIPEDMPAFVHKGEMILPPGLAESFRRFLGGGGAAASVVTVLAGDGAGGRGGDTYITNNITVPITGLLKAERPSDVAGAMRRIADMGYLSPRPAR